MSMPAAERVGRSCLAEPPRASKPDAPYLLAPVPLALDLRDSPLALGIYLLVARVYLVRKTPVPLSTADVQAYDAAAVPSRGAILRALDRLVGGGWLIPQTSPGHKSTYLPAWGQADGVARPWAMGEPSLGRPRSIRTVRVPCDLLDICLGRLTPHTRHTALIERYITRPALTLADVGAYALTLAGLGQPTDALCRLGLADDTNLLPVPHPTALLARISQLPLINPALGDPPALSAHGLRRVGLYPPPAPRAADGHPLFFVPPGVIGEVIGPMIEQRIGSASDFPPRSSASQCTPLPLPCDRAASHGEIGSDGYTTTHSDSCRSLAGTDGGGDQPDPDTAPAQPVCTRSVPVSERVQERGGERTPPPSPLHIASPSPVVAPQCSETERQLRALGVRADTARQLADRPVIQVTQVIAQARVRGGVRDIAAWVVSALRALPADVVLSTPGEDRPLSAQPIYTHGGLTEEQRSTWLRRFHAAPTPHEQRAVLDRLSREHPR